MNRAEATRQMYNEAETCFKAGDSIGGYAFFRVAERELGTLLEIDPVQYLSLYLLGEQLVRRYMLP